MINYTHNGLKKTKDWQTKQINYTKRKVNQNRRSNNLKYNKLKSIKSQKLQNKYNMKLIKRKQDLKIEKVNQHKKKFNKIALKMNQR